MIRTSFAFVLLIAGLAAPMATAAPALRPGEELTFDVSWLILDAGQIRIAAREGEPENGSPRLLIETTTRTTGLTKLFFPFTAKAESVYDTRSGRLLRINETSSQRRKDTKQSISFDYANSVAKYVNDIEPQKNADIPMPQGDPIDLILALVQTRAWDDMKPGDARDTLVIFDDEFYELTIHALDYENLRTPLGNFRTLVLEPKMEKTEPKGMFKRGSTVKVWISQDEQHLPVKFAVDMNVVGDGIATLVRHVEPPAVAANN